MAKGKKQTAAQRRRAQARASTAPPQASSQAKRERQQQPAAQRPPEQPAPARQPRQAQTADGGKRRLGTGAGIARESRGPHRSGGLWTWILAGAAVVVAAIIVGAVLSRGGGSSSTPSSSVVTAALSHSKLDPISQPTWVPNYDNLPQRLKALGMPGVSQVVNHYHAHVTLYVNGRQVRLPAQIGLPSTMNGGESPVHTHTDNGIIHIEADDPNFRGTIGDLFDVWGVYLSKQCVGGYCDGVKAWVDGKPVSDPSAIRMQEHDAITIVEGKPPAGFTPDKSYKFPKGL